MTRRSRSPRRRPSRTVRRRAWATPSQRAENVTALIKDAYPISLSLAVAAFIMWMAGGVLFGVIAALRRGSLIDRGIVGVSLVFYAFPTFFIGLLLYKFVAIKWQMGPEYPSTSR